MPKPPDIVELEDNPTNECKYDFAQASRILKAMEFLRIEAEATNIEEIVTMIDAAFQILVTTYYCILRYEMNKLPGIADSEE
jgi:hypothetical protein